MTQPVVTFHRPEGASNLNADDLFGDIGDLPRTSHAATPVRIEEQASTQAAAELIDLGRYEEAMAAYDEHLRANPTDRSARAGRELAFGLKLAAAGDRSGAAQHLEAALEIEPWSERTARELNNIRRSVTDNRKGLLSKLLGKVT
jgi:tetratricopeptide (TPR) repeat protein